VYRLYRERALSVRKRRRRKYVMVDRQALYVPHSPNEVWSIDFVMDTLANGRRIKCLTVVDDFTRECLDIAVDTGSRAATLLRYSSASASSVVCRGRFAPIKALNSQAVRSIAGPMARAWI
jgi:putative transposase